MNLEARHCILCGPASSKKVRYPATFSAEDLNVRIFSARRSPDRIHFRIVECRDCGMVFSDPATDSSVLSELYGRSELTYGSQEEQIYQSYVPVLNRGLLKARSRNLFVEIGGGSGFLLKYGVENGFKSQIEIEPSAQAEERFSPVLGGNSKFVRSVFGPSLLAESSASLVCFFQILDHVPNPVSFLRELYRALEPGGVAVCVTHDTKAFTAKILGERSPIFDIEHTYLFHRGNLKALFEKVGFGDVESFSVANRYALRYWAHLAPIPAVGKAFLLKTIEGLGLGDMQIRLHAGNFGLVAQKT